MRLSILIERDGNMFVANCLETPVFTRTASLHDAVNNIQAMMIACTNDDLPWLWISRPQRDFTRFEAGIRLEWLGNTYGQELPYERRPPILDIRLVA